MSISKPFAYNVGGPISGTTQYGDLVVGNIETDYSLNYGGVKWWGGPDEELGYVIGNARPGGQPVPVGVTGPAYVGFWRSKFLTDNSFLSLANYIGAQNSQPSFTTTIAAVTWLNNNGYYTSYQTAYYFGGGFTLTDFVVANNAISLNTDGSKDTSFDIGSGFGFSVFSTEIQSDGKILAGGDFTTFTGSSQNYLIRLNSDGSKDTSFDIGNGFNSSVQSTSIQSDGKILVGGYFTTFTGSTQNRLIRLNSNGSKDTSFDIGSGFNFYVFSTSIQSDGKILVGGTFTTFTGSSQNCLIRLNSNGSKDSTFNIGTGFNSIFSSVYSTPIQSDGKILVGGDFVSYQGSTQNYLIRLNSDGSKDTSFNIGSGFGSIVYSIAIQSDGKILVGGDFTTFSGSSQNRLIRLNSDGSKDTSFDIGTGFNDEVYSINVQSDGKILVGGTFTTFTGSSQNCFIRLNSNGSKDTSFDIGTGFGSFVRSTQIQSNGKILVGGDFTTFSGSSQNGILKTLNYSLDTSFNIGTGFNNNVYSIIIQSDEKVLVGGQFTTYQGSTQNYLIRLNTDGSKDTSFNIGTGFGNLIRSIVIQSDGKVLVGGDYTTFTGSTQNRLIRLNSNGSKDTSFDIGNGFNSSVQSTSIQSDGKILVGGNFTTFTGSTQNRLIRLNSNGSKDTSFDIGSGFNGNVQSTSIQSDGKILVGGSFTTFTGSSQNRLIRFNSDGSKDTSFNIGTGFNNSVFTIAIQSDGKVLVGGFFTTFNGSTQNCLIRLNTDGSKDTSFNIGSGFGGIVYSIAIQSDGKILVGGLFNTYNGSSALHNVLLNSDGSISNNPLLLNYQVRSVVIQ
jgi:uncharacterized delta-60 repeat protein